MYCTVLSIRTFALQPSPALCAHQRNCTCNPPFPHLFNGERKLDYIGWDSTEHRGQRQKELRALQRKNTEISKQIFPEKEYRGLSPNFHIHASVSDLYIPTIGLPILLEEICRPILGLYKSLTDTWMWKLGLRPALFQEREYISEIFVAVRSGRACFVLWWKLKKACCVHSFSRESSAASYLQLYVTAGIKHFYFTWCDGNDRTLPHGEQPNGIDSQLNFCKIFLWKISFK